MMKNEIAHPKIVGREEWLTPCKTLLEHEKEYTKHRDRIYSSTNSSVSPLTS